MDLALSAISQGAGDWLREKVQQDFDSCVPFRVKRALTISGYIIPIDIEKSAHGCAVASTSWEMIEQRTQQLKNKAIYARYWWKSFLLANDCLTAFCSWQNFLQCANKMAWVWLEEDIEKFRGAAPFWERKMLHLSFNRSQLLDALAEKSSSSPDRLDDRLVGWDGPLNWLIDEDLRLCSF